MSDSYMVITEKDWEQADEKKRSWGYKKSCIIIEVVI
jgi:hypothetical protein